MKRERDWTGVAFFILALGIIAIFMLAIIFVDDPAPERRCVLTSRDPIVVVCS